MMKEFFDSYCGLKCSECEFLLNKTCGGCIASGGNPFHGKCDVAECAKGKNRRFCGECGDFACNILKGYAFDKEHGDNGARLENCTAIKKTLVANAREGLDPVSRCGHHCDFCFLGEWCGGCRSDYNCCSFATICESGQCPNVSCSNEKGLDGCYECGELDSCVKGYYGQKNEYVAKATAKFIGRYGKEIYTKTLKKAIDAGEKYAGSFDEKGSVEGALALLESYINK